MNRQEYEKASSQRLFENSRSLAERFVLDDGCAGAVRGLADATTARKAAQEGALTGGEKGVEAYREACETERTFALFLAGIVAGHLATGGPGK